MERAWQFSLVVLMVLLLALSAWQTLEPTRTIPYSQFLELLENGKVAEVTLSGDQLRGQLKQPEKEGWKLFSTRPVNPELAELLARHNVKFSNEGSGGSFWGELALWFLFPLFLVVIMTAGLRRLREPGENRLDSFGASRAKVYEEKNIRTTFAEVAGVDEAKADLEEVVSFLRNPRDYNRLGAHLPRGIMLVGPPGTGKTLLARALAGEAGVPFFSINGSEFVEMFVGVGAARVRDLFARAKKSAPCIIFIDELDALGRARSGVSGLSGHDEKDQTLNQLLSELDGFDPQRGIVLLAATNRPETLDPALLRAGRFDRHVLVDRPDKNGRLAILKVHVRGVPLAPSVDLSEVAGLTTGFTGAELANLVNEAAIIATRRKAVSVGPDDFVGALERLVAGLEKKTRLLNPAEREIVAFHESGHAMVALALPGTETVHKVSIIPRGIGALGYNIQRPAEDRYLTTRRELETKMAVLLGGRAAEMLIFGVPTTGASDDLDKATSLARHMVMRYGMSDSLGLATVADEQPLEKRACSEETAARVDRSVRELVEQAFRRALEALERNREPLERMARALLQKETLNADELPQPVWRGDAYDGDHRAAPVEQVG